MFGLSEKNASKNGAIGKLGDFVEAKGRWLVEFSSGNSNNFKEENLHLMPDLPADDDEELPITAKIYIQNLGADATEQGLMELFGGVGLIAKEPIRSGKGAAKGFQDEWPYAVKLYKPGKDGGDAQVTYMDKMAAKTAVRTYNGYKWKNNKISVSYAGQGKQFEKRELTLPWAEREENLGKIHDLLHK